MNYGCGSTGIPKRRNRRQRKQPPLRRQQRDPRPPVPRDCRRHHDARAGTTFNHHNGRPGPNSRDPLLMHQDLLNNMSHECPSEWIDVRVGGRFRHTPPGAQQDPAYHFIRLAKFLGPSCCRAHSQATGAQITPIMHYCYQLQFTCMYEGFQRQLPLPAPTLATAAATPIRPLPLEPTSAACLSLVILVCMGGMIHLLDCWLKGCMHRHKYCTRICPGTYRRREGPSPHKRVLAIVRRRMGQPEPSSVSCTLAMARRKSDTHWKPHLGRTLSIVCLLLFWGAQCVQADPLQHHNHPSPTATPLPRGQIITSHGVSAMQTTACKKRSFRRAQARALRHGETMYRGRLHTPASLSLHRLAHQANPRPARTLSVDPSTRQAYIRVLSWNCGGLHSARYTETLTWLADIRPHTPIDIVCLQETKWRDSSEFSNATWHCVHSGSGAAQAGILFLIHKSLITQDSIRFNHIQ